MRKSTTTRKRVRGTKPKSQLVSELIAKITSDIRMELHAAGVPDPRISEWRAGTGKPTISQLRALAYVMGADFHALAKDDAMAGANRVMKAYFLRKEAEQGQETAQGKLFNEGPLPH